MKKGIILKVSVDATFTETVFSRIASAKAGEAVPVTIDELRDLQRFFEGLHLDPDIIMFGRRIIDENGNRVDPLTGKVRP